MNTTQESYVKITQDRLLLHEGKKNETDSNGETKAESDGAKATIDDLFPWIIEFKKKCRSSLAQPNIVALIQLMEFYVRNVSVNVNECYTKPYRAAKLKDSISETLLFFLFYYREIVEVCDRNSYLDKMSDLLAMFIDMELKASRRGKEHHGKIAARITSCLYVYLEDSHDHILDTFIKARFINRNYHEILDPVLTKISNIITEQPNCDASYVRYLLIYRLWKKVNNDAAVKNHINATAISHLGPPPASPTPFLAKYVLPKVPKSQANSTKFLLLHKFDIEKSCRFFVQYCKENREDEDQPELEKPTSSDSLEPFGGRGKEIPVENLSDKVNIPDAEKGQKILIKAKEVSESYGDKFSEVEECTKNSGCQESLAKEKSTGITLLKRRKSVKLLQRQKKKTKKTGDILFIDLTADEITEKVIKKKKVLKHHWLTEAKKNLKKKVGKLSEKKKKKKVHENLATNNLSQDFTFLDLTDRTSDKTLSTVTTTELETASTDSALAKSLSTTFTPKPDNHVTSNFVDNYFDLGSDDADASPDSSVEKQSTCVVTTTTTTTTVTESVSAVSNAPTPRANSVSNGASQRGEKSCEISVKKPDACPIGGLLNALSNICESYDSDSVNDSAENSTKWDENAQFASKEISSTEADDSLKDSELQRSLSESSEVAVIFTRRASDVDIVDLDSYSEENCETQSSDTFAKLETGTENGKEQLENENERKKSVSDDLIGLNSDIEHLNLRTGQQPELSRIGETLQAIEDSVKQQGIDDKEKKFEEIVKEKRNGIIKNENLKECEKITGAKIDICWTGDDDSITIVNREPKSKSFTKIEPHDEFKVGDQRFEENTLEKMEKSEAVNYRNGENHCDRRSSKGDRLDDVESQPSRELKIAKREEPNFADGEVPSVRKDFTEERTPIPKIKEIVIRPKNVDNDVCNTSNDLLRVEEPRFNENIDGLSLLASVSQHVSHLEECSEKTLSKPKIINGEIRPTDNGPKIYSPNANAPNVDLGTEEVFGTRNSYKLFLDLNAESSNEKMNEIFGVPRQLNNEDKTNFNELKSKSSEFYDKNSSDIVPLILETTVDLSSNKLQNNVISVENVTQIIKDSANVIVNGEMVVLFQKSPNSNLYIINNKAVDGEEQKKIVKKNIERTSTAMRDIINHIPINQSEKNVDGVKIHRSSKGFFPTKNKTLVKKIENSEKKYENHLISKQFQPPICGEKFYPYVDKLDGDYIKKEILNNEIYEDEWRQRCEDLSGSAIELQPVKKSPSPVVRPADTPINLKTHRCEDTSGPLNMVTNGRTNGKLGIKKREDKSKGMLNKTLTYKQNIKQEFTSCVDDTADKISCCYGGQISSNDSKQLALQNFPSGFNTGHFIPAVPLDSKKIPHVYSTVTTATNLFSCDYSSCSLKVSSSQSYQSVPQAIPNCQLSHCACLKCAYDIHCGEYVEHSTTVADSKSYLQTNSYYLPADSSIKNCTIQKEELKLNEAALAKLHDDELLHNIEQSIMDVDKKASSDIAEVKTVPEVKYKLEFENKLPLKKRLKSHAMLSMSYQEVPMKIQKVENYPGTPMMSIAALETGSESNNTGNLYDEKAVSSSTPQEMEPGVKDDSCHHAREMIRRDYLKDTSLTSIGNCANVDDRVRNAVAGCQRSFKTMAQRKEITVPVACSLKRAASGTASNPKSPKLLKKTKTVSTKCRQTRSSKRNIPKVDYSYDGIVDLDPKWNASNELKRKRKKTNR